MKQLRRILRLQHERNSKRDIVRVTGIARTTVLRALERSKAAKLVWLRIPTKPATYSDTKPATVPI